MAIARALAVDPPLLLMDEPTASLDPARRDDLGDTLRSLTAAGRTLLMATHDDDLVRDFADRVAVMANGEVVEEGEPRAVLSNPAHPETVRLLQRTGTGNRGPGTGGRGSAVDVPSPLSWSSLRPNQSPIPDP